MKKELLLISIATDSHRNIGCLSLYSTAVDAEIPTHLLFIPREAEFNEVEFAELLKSNKYRVVGISLTTRDFYFACKLTSLIRNYLPESHILWGGIHPTCKPEECLEHADSICIGEGERLLVDLVNALRENLEISKISGLGFKLEDKMVLNPSRLIKDLNTLPFPRFDFEYFYVLDSEGLHKFGPDDYVKYSRHSGDGYVLMTSRSCPHNCSYCINSFLNRLYEDNEKRLVRRITVDNVIKELKYALDTIPGIGFINFMDDHFLTDSKWIQEFCSKYKESINLPFIIRATPITVKEKYISILKDAGLQTVQMGIQSGSKKTHKEIFHRSFNEQTVLSAAKILNQHNLECLFDFIIENDFETSEDRDKTIELMMKLPKPFIANLFVMTVFPKTDLESIYKERNMTPRVDPYSSNYFEFHKSDFHYQLASLIPLIEEKEAHFFFDNRGDENVLTQLRELFQKKVGSAI